MIGGVDDHATGASQDVAYYVSKILAPLLLFCLTNAFGLIPILIVKVEEETEESQKKKTHAGQTRDSKIISFTACVGGGVLFATALMHILPEARSGFERWSSQSNHSDAHDHHDHDHHESHHDLQRGHNHGFPLTEFVVCLGFLIVYLIDEVISACLGHKSHANEDHGHSHSPQVIQCATNGEQAIAPASKPYGHITAFNQMESGHSNAPMARVKATPVSIRGLITVAALSFHSVFEGLSLGLQDSTGKTWLLTLAIAMHKLAIAFVVGFELCVTGNKKGFVIVNILIFSIMSPIGAFTGFMAQAMIEQNTFVVALLNGIACGTLLFVVFFEVLQKQKNTSLHGLLQLLAVILGFAIMLALGQLVAFLSEIDTPPHFYEAASSVYDAVNVTAQSLLTH